MGSRYHSNRSIRTIIAVFSALLLVCSLYMPVLADASLNTSITITVENPPDGDYCIALLEKREPNIDQDMVDRLEGNKREMALFVLNYYVDGYSFSQNPVNPQFRWSNENNVFRFSFDVPSTFKVLIVTADGQTYVSNAITRKNFNSECTYDVQTGKLEENVITKRSVTERVVEIFVFFIATIVSESLVVLFFPLPYKKNAKYIWRINIITQIFLNIVIIIAFYLFREYYFLIVLYAEILITITECLYYRKRLVDRKDKCVPELNILYGIIANIASIFAGLISMFWSWMISMFVMSLLW